LTSSIEEEVYGAGPNSTFPASWDNPCGFVVHGNKTTEFGSSLPPNFNMTQVYYQIVNSSVFNTLAAGRTWVTMQWAGFQLSNRTGSYTVVAADFIFVSGGGPVGFAQMDYFVGSGEVTVGYNGPLMSECPLATATTYSYKTNLVGAITHAPLNYSAGQPVEINFTVYDGTVANFSVTANTACLGNFTVLQGFGTNGTAVYDSAKHPGCSEPPLDIVLNPNESYMQTVEWDQTNDSGVQVPPGDYQIMATMAGQPWPMFVGEVIIGNASA